MPASIDPTPAETIAIELTKISDAMGKLLRGGLKRKTLLVLISHESGLPQRDCAAVLESIENLRADWCS